ncbi:MAG: hypothetical protein ACFFKA_05225 [Candidatus Thorarchaeota archaeon]
MNSENLEGSRNGENIGMNGRICSEVYSCVEDIYYFINLAPPFVN